MQQPYSRRAGMDDPGGAHIVRPLPWLELENDIYGKTPAGRPARTRVMP